jgi:hypothetical protein
MTIDDATPDVTRQVWDVVILTRQLLTGAYLLLNGKHLCEGLPLTFVHIALMLSHGLWGKLCASSRGSVARLFASHGIK